MGVLLLLFGLGVLCVLLWYCAVYALPLWAGFAAAFWALAHGAGVGAVVVGLVAAAALFVLGRVAALSANPVARWIALAAFTAPAVYAGFSIVWALSTSAVPSPAWRAILSIVTSVLVGATTVAKLVEQPATMHTGISH